jgi:hypothetical protein
MAAVVVAPPAPRGVPSNGVPLSIFPGSATPAVFPARTPFWIGSAFVPEPGDTAVEGVDAFHERTGLELEIDGAPVRLATDLAVEDGRTVQKLSIAVFGAGLPAGWHRFTARWYVAGKLVLSSDRSIEFVER